MRVDAKGVRLFAPFVLLIIASFWGCTAPKSTRTRAGVNLGGKSGSPIRSIAYLVHHMEAMSAFYAEAFGIEWEEVETFGVSSRFGDLGSVTLKLVPLRGQDDFEGFPDLQLGFEVHDIERVIAIAEAHGGRREGDRIEEGDLFHAAVRDPDGNTIELYQRKTP